jgi:hypothetical protein
MTSTARWYAWARRRPPIAPISTGTRAIMIHSADPRSGVIDDGSIAKVGVVDRGKHRYGEPSHGRADTLAPQSSATGRIATV